MARLSTDERIARMTFSSVYPHYVKKVTKKGRTEEELIAIISWLSGYSLCELQAHISGTSTFEAFFSDATLPPEATEIRGTICGIRVENIENPLSRRVRYLDKIVDELAKGKLLSEIIRT
jgi:hypothetical protein